MIALDTNIFIYVLENNPEFGQRAASALRSAQNDGAASAIVYLELLSSAAFHTNNIQRNIALNFLNEQRLIYIEPLKDTLILAAELRAANSAKLELGDAIHLASALAAGADTFITNDQNLLKLQVKDLKVISL